MIDALPLLLGPEGYQISRSVRLRSSASGYFTRTPSSASGQQTFTLSAWVKRGKISAQQVIFGINSASTNIFTLSFLAGDTLIVFGRNAGSDVLNLTTTAVYRDPSAWYHIVIAIDTTQATSSNRARMYVNGVEVTAFGTATYPAQNTSLAWNSNSYAHDIGRESTGNYFDGYTTEINHISGTQLTPPSFGETNPVTGVWQPKKYTGTYGTNGFYLNFSDNSGATATTIGKDYSGNGNNWTPNNISVTAGVTYDSMLDVPTQWADGGNGRGNYATLNPLVEATNVTYARGNLQASSSVAYRTVASTMQIPTTGKWYWEIFITASGSVTHCGVANGNPSVWLNTWAGNTANGWVYTGGSGQKYHNGTAGTYGASFTTNDVISVAFDADTGSLYFAKNGQWANGAGASNQLFVNAVAAYTGLTSIPYTPVVSLANSETIDANFGQRPFAYTPPSGFKALNTLNLP